MRGIICLMALVSSARQDIVAQGTTAAMRVLVQRTVPQARPVVHLVQTVRQVIGAGTAMICTILFTNVIKTFPILHHMVLGHKTVITPVVQGPAQSMRGIAVQVVILKR